MRMCAAPEVPSTGATSIGIQVFPLEKKCDLYKVSLGSRQVGWRVTHPLASPTISESREIRSRSAAGYGHCDTYLPTLYLERATDYTEHRKRLKYAARGRWAGSKAKALVCPREIAGERA